MKDNIKQKGVLQMIKTIGIINSNGEFKPLVHVQSEKEIEYYREMWESQGYKVEVK